MMLTEDEILDLELEFINFLKSHEAYSRFETNHKLQYEDESVEDFLLRILLVENNIIDTTKFIKDVLFYGFIWMDTPEGHDYWKDLDSDWKILIQKLNVVH